MLMEIYRDLFNPEIVGLDQGSFITIGSFDGVHRGHQQLISTLVREGANNDCPAILITFDPLPKEYFGLADSKAIRLTSSQTRAQRIAEMGVDILLEYTFDHSFSQISADDFIHMILMNLNPKKFFIGEDFRFGHKGAGDFPLLRQKGLDFGFETVILDFVDMDHERISSTKVRRAIQNGDLLLAADLMGNEHEMAGRMIRGLNEKSFFVPHSEVILPSSGEYWVTIKIANKKHVAKAKIIRANRSIELDWDKQMMNPFTKEDVVLCFTRNAQKRTAFMHRIRKSIGLPS
jgi:riboflavin kinase/FMN adenylyltransferase